MPTPRGPDYSSNSYWETRFHGSGSDPREHNGRGFEWLNDGQAALIQPLVSFLSNRPQGRKARILHIGIGSSQLSCDILENLGGDRVDVVNVDFAPSAIEFAKRVERQRFTEEKELRMQYHVVDLLDWTSVKMLGEDFDAVLDKSTTDSISTGPDLRLVLDREAPADQVAITDQDDAIRTISMNAEAATVQLCPTVSTLLDKQSQATLSPVHLLSLHLSAIMPPGGRWFCLSYSADRWRDVPAQQWPWKVIESTPVEVVDVKVAAGVAVRPMFTPKVYHQAYVLECS